MILIVDKTVIMSDSTDSTDWSERYVLLLQRHKLGQLMTARIWTFFL